MCITPNLVYINKNLRNKKNPHGIFFSKWSKAQEETFQANVQDIGGEFYKIPCRQCAECKIMMAKEWAIRAFAEYQTNPTAYFITLTYEHNPVSLILSDIQNFIKTIRDNNRNLKIKYIGCGEYGEKNMRPHFHLILYGLFLPDLKTSIYNLEENDHRLMESEIINKYWNKGLAIIEQVNYMNCRYVAGYVEKKLDTKDYNKLKLKQPFHIYSKGIGEDYFNKNYKEIYKTDEIIIHDIKSKPPRYYDRLLFERDIKLYKKIKETRRKSGELMSSNPISDYEYFKTYAINREDNINAKLKAKTRQID